MSRSFQVKVCNHSSPVGQSRTRFLFLEGDSIPQVPFSTGVGSFPSVAVAVAAVVVVVVVVVVIPLF
jgi:hypothetical protein